MSIFRGFSMSKLQKFHGTARAASWRRRLGYCCATALAVVVGGLNAPSSVKAQVEVRLADVMPTVVSAARSKPEIEPALLDLLSSGKPAQFALFLERPDLSPAFGMDWQTRGRFVMETLQQAAERLQAPLREHLRAQGYSFRHFWVDNVIVVDDGDMRLLEDIGLFEGVKAARLLPEVFLIEPEEISLAGSPPPGPIPNLVRVKAPDVWAMGHTGSDMVVASIDTGVRFTHEALRDKYRGWLGGSSFDHNYNFFNPYSSDIGDSDNHGSHVTGTMVGGTATETIGMAPDAQWIACRGFNPGGTTPGLLACGQWVAAPTDLAGNNPEPDLRPHVVNNSWGNCQQSYDPWYQGVVNTWIAAGIVPIFANGNASNCGYPSPPGLNTVGNPARYGTVMGIGSTGNSNGQYANHSNWGPTDNPSPGLPDHPDHFGFPNIKPNVVAPGVGIRSATRGSDSSYANFTGTSMSAPHAAGLVALMWDAAPCLIGDYAKTGTIMMDTAVRIPYNSGGSPPPGPGNIPNYATGWGEIDALAAVEAAILECGPQGIIAGTVTDSSTSSPIAGVSVQFINPNPPPPTYSATTDAAGQYSRSVAEGDGYSVSFSRYGYLPTTVTDVDVEEGQTTTVNVALDPAPTFNVTGTVTDADTGWGLHARIDIGGFPGGPVWTDPVTGAYSIALVAGTEFTFSVTTEIPGYLSSSRSVGPLVADAVEDFELDVALNCTAPGRTASASDVLVENFEGSFPPAGWTSASLGGAAACIWRRNDQLVNQAGNPVAPRPNYAGGQGFSAAADSDRCGSGSTMHTELRMPAVDLTAIAGPVLDYVVSYRHLGSSRLFTEISTNGGSTWTILQELSASLSPTGPGTPQSFDLSAFASSSNAQVRFRYLAPGWDWWGQVDQVRLRSVTCTVPDGDLVVGTVSDANTAARLTGALVNAGSNSVTSYTSADPAVGAGFYAIYAPPASVEVEADGSPVHPGYGTVSAPITVAGGQTQRVDLDVPAGRLTLVPSSVTKNIELGQTDSENIALINSGDIPATVSLAAQASFSEDFEGAFPPPGWSATDGPGATPNCGWRRNDQWGLPNFAGGQGFSAAVDSDACGSGSQTRALLTLPPFDFSLASVVQLDFVLAYQHLTGPNNFLRIEVSNNGGSTWTTVQNYTASISPQGPGTPQSFNLASQLAGAADARIRFFYSGDWAWWALIDQVRVTSDVPWLTINPGGGTFSVEPSATGFLATLNFDAGAVPSVGQYHASLVVTHDTPYPVPSMPITMNVTAPASFGELNGTVQSLGYCDAAPAPAAGAAVTVISNANTYNLTTNASGQYSLFLDSGESPLEIVVSAAQHLGQSRDGVVVTAGGVTTEDFDLRLDAPCASVAPTSLGASVVQGGSTSQLLTLSNDGAGELTWDTAFDASLMQKVSLDGSAKPNEPAVRVPVRTSWKAAGLSQAGNAGQPQGIGDAPAGNGGVALVLDDGTHENAVGLTNGGTFVWFNRFTPTADYPFRLEELWIMFRQGTGINVGEIVDLYVYTDADGNPANGATHVASYTGVPVGAVDGTTWTVVDLPSPLLLEGPGDVWIVAVNRTAGTGAGTFVAAIDQTASQVRSWVGIDPGGIPNPPVFPTPTFGTIDSFGLPGNWMLRGYGVGSCGEPLPGWLSVDPDSGTVAGDDSTEIEVGFDASALSPGVYEGTLCLLTNDDNAAILQVPVTLTVVPAQEAIFADGFESP
jgi:subtilisin family serine protease